MIIIFHPPTHTHIRSYMPRSTLRASNNRSSRVGLNRHAAHGPDGQMDWPHLEASRPRVGRSGRYVSPPVDWDLINVVDWHRGRRATPCGMWPYYCSDLTECDYASRQTIRLNFGGNVLNKHVRKTLSAHSSQFSRRLFFHHRSIHTIAVTVRRRITLLERSCCGGEYWVMCKNGMAYIDTEEQCSHEKRRQNSTRAPGRHVMMPYRCGRPSASDRRQRCSYIATARFGPTRCINTTMTTAEHWSNDAIMWFNVTLMQYKLARKINVYYVRLVVDGQENSHTQWNKLPGIGRNTWRERKRERERERGEGEKAAMLWKRWQTKCILLYNLVQHVCLERLDLWCNLRWTCFCRTKQLDFVNILGDWCWDDCAYHEVESRITATFEQQRLREAVEWIMTLWISNSTICICPNKTFKSSRRRSQCRVQYLQSVDCHRITFIKNASTQDGGCSSASVRRDYCVCA